MTRIRFTKRELDMLDSMCGIASANEWAEGYYFDDVWKADDAEVVFNSVWDKVMTLQVRCESKEFWADVAQLTRAELKRQNTK